MPKLEKTLHGDMDEIHKKILHGVCANCPQAEKRDVWDTTMGDVRCILTVFEKNAPKIQIADDDPRYPWHHDYGDEEKYRSQPHYSLAVTMLGQGDEIRLCSITSGGSQNMYYIPYTPGEAALHEALDLTLNQLDNMIL